MSKQLDCLQNNFEITNGQVNFDGSLYQFSEISSDKKVDLSKIYTTSENSNGPKTEQSNQQGTTSEVLDLQNERKSQQESDMFSYLNQIEEVQNPDQQFNGALQQTTATDNRINEEISSSSATSDSLIQSKSQLASINEVNERNDSKNVPKGMMKAFAHMVLDKDPNIVRTLKEYFESSGESYKKFRDQMEKIRKSTRISISEIRQYLIKNEFAVTIRKLGCYFLRKRFMNHIFNSKMVKRHIHIKYIPKWMDVFKNPSEFTSLK